MKTLTINAEFIDRNFQKTLGLIENTNKTKDTPSPLWKMINSFGDRYALCPASSKTEYYSCFPGGLAYHNLCVLNWFTKFAQTLSIESYSASTFLKLSLLHDIGKIGSLEKEYYLPQESAWHKERGILYEVNPDLNYMRISQRSLYLAQEYGVPLSEEEYLAILLHDGQSDEANASYKYKEPKLSLALNWAIEWARRQEKEYKVVLE